MSRKALLQRQKAALRTGYRSEIVQKLSNCHNCFYRHYCKFKDTLTEEQQNKGCKDIREAFIANLNELTHPEAMLAKHIANLQIELDLKGLMDGKDQEGFSKDRMRLYHLIKDFMKLLLDYKDVKAKYTVGTKSQIDVVHKFEDDEVFEVEGEDS